MDVDKLNSPPFAAELPFGPNPDDILHMMLNRDIITENFLLSMDHSARRIFDSTLASARLAIGAQGRKLGNAGTAEVKAVGGARKARRPTKAQLRAIEAAAQKKTADDVIDELSKMLPSENESWLLAQAEECVYMSETLARVILSWDLTKGGVVIPITTPRELDCCKAEGSDCRHPSDFLKSRPLEVLRKLFQFCLFEAQAPKKKAGTR